jgi:hypothetical protein
MTNDVGIPGTDFGQAQQKMAGLNRLMGCRCPLEDAIHYLLECPLYTNASMQLVMSITPYTVISIENLLFGSDNFT